MRTRNHPYLSTPPAGSHACLTGKGAQPSRPGCAAPPARRQRKPIRTLVVDDSPLMLRTLSVFLETLSDFQLIGSAMDGYRALRYSAELDPDLVLMDLQLPGMSGLEVTRRLKAQSPAPTVIMVTADDTPECRAAASAAGADGFVGKQALFTQLLPTMRTLFPENADQDS